MKIGSIELQTERDVKKGEEVSIEDLFPWHDYDEVQKVFDLSMDVERGLPIKVKVDKVGVIEAKADTTKKQGALPLIGLWMLLSFPDLRKKITASEDVKKNEMLAVSLETAN